MESTSGGGIERAVLNSTDMNPALAARIADYGWHVQLDMPVDAIVADAAMLARFPA